MSLKTRIEEGAFALLEAEVELLIILYNEMDRSTHIRFSG